MKNATLKEYLQARIETLENENKKLRIDNHRLSNIITALKREKVAMQTR